MRARPAMALCARCDSLNIESFQTHPEASKPSSSKDEAALTAYPLWSRGGELGQSRDRCAFCALAWASLVQAAAAMAAPGQQRAELVLAEAEVRLEPKTDVHRTAFPESTSTGLHLTSLHVIATASTSSGPKLLRGKIRLLLEGRAPCKSASHNRTFPRPTYGL